jgi:uncharacterized membrane protein HdeD (DUF308 family)
MASLSEQAYEEKRGWLALAGSLMLAFGILAAMAPVMASISIELAAGWLLLLGGLFGLGLTVVGPPAGTSAWWWNLASSTFASTVGALLLWYPSFGMASTTPVLAGYLAASGIAKLVIARRHRSRVGALAPWIAAAGILDFAIAWMVLSQWPLSSVWFLGLLVGINLSSGGMLLLGGALRKSSPSTLAKAAAPQPRTFPFG